MTRLKVASFHYFDGKIEGKVYKIIKYIYIYILIIMKL